MTSTSRRVRVTVVAGDRRADLTIPGHVAVAGLLPDLVSRLEVPEPVVRSGVRLFTLLGDPLADDAGLLEQGIGHGTVVVLDRAEEPASLPYDDVPDAVTEVLLARAAGEGPGAPSTGSPVLVASVVLLVTGAGLLAVSAGGVGTATAGALALGSVAAWLSRRREPGAGVAVAASTSCLYAAVAGLQVGRPLGAGPALTGAGLALTLAAALGAVTLAGERDVLLVPALVGPVLAASGLAAGWGRLGPVTALGTAMTGVVVAGRWSADAALLLTPTGRPGRPGREVGARHRVSARSVAADVARADRLLDLQVVAIALVLTLAVPVTASRPAGAVVAVLDSVLLLLAGRRLPRRGAPPWLAVGGGLVGLVETAVCLVRLAPGWLPWLGATTSAVGLALGVASRGGPRVSRLLDVVEALCLTGVLPALVGLAASDAPLWPGWSG